MSESPTSIGSELVVGILTVLATSFLHWIIRGPLKRRRMLKSLLIYLNKDYKLIEYPKGNVTLTTDYLDQIYTEGNLTLCSKEFTETFNWYRNTIDEKNTEYIVNNQRVGKKPPKNYYQDLKSINLQLQDKANLELQYFPKKWYRKINTQFDRWKRNEPSVWKAIKIILPAFIILIIIIIVLSVMILIN